MSKNKKRRNIHENKTNHILEDEQLQDISGGIDLERFNKAYKQWKKDDPGKKVTLETVDYLLKVVEMKNCSEHKKKCLLSYLQHWSPGKD